MPTQLIPPNKINDLAKVFKGEILSDEYSRMLYATDASVYREFPALVVRPTDKQDISELIRFANASNTPIIVRAAGTSLAGQVVGSGIVADVGRYMNRVIELNVDEKWIRVQPGVVLDELNKFLEPQGLFFGPETSTSNRCMMGGMVGNNSCGSHSLVYGSTRDHLLEVTAFLSDGSEVVFGEVSEAELDKKCSQSNLEGKIYKQLRDILSNPRNRKEIIDEFPDPSVHRRNTGYALDLLLNSSPFVPDAKPFNLCNLIAGSEGTLCFITEIKLNLVPLPPAYNALVAVHCSTLREAFEANLVALQCQPVAVELMDDAILQLTKANITQRKNRFFLEGDPAAVLLVEIAEESEDALRQKAQLVVQSMQKANFGYHHPIVYGKDINKVWALRKAGLGVLSNMPGDAKPVAVIEDTAVNPELLTAYMDDFAAMLKKLGLSCVYYAHIATGELHLRPVLDLKNPSDVEKFHTVALETARLVKKYKGSLSGEHGDGRLRGEFIRLMVGDHIYSIFEQIKDTWDPKGLLNPGKITRTPPMNRFLRYDAGVAVGEPETVFDFSSTDGLLRAAEKCNGSADCRKSEIIGGTMCPSYMATRDEKNTTRARANTLREFLTRSPKINRFDHQEIYQSLDLCLSCKGCKSECPSNVDMARYKAEFLHHWHQANGIPLRTRLIANISIINRLGMVWPGAYNFVVQNRMLSGLLKRSLGFSGSRKLPTLSPRTFSALLKKNKPLAEKVARGEVYLFVDEFTNYNEASLGTTTVSLLQRLGYQVKFVEHAESGRAYLSKGLIETARKMARQNVGIFHPLVTNQTPLLGIEPSAILTFRDEYPDLVGPDLKEKALALAQRCFTVEEFLAAELSRGTDFGEVFTDEPKTIWLHGHCHQKALSSTAGTIQLLSLPKNYNVREIKSGCCGMAGSFGYEKEHEPLSMAVGELVLFPAVREAGSGDLIAAPGTSCRHQIADGTGRQALHPLEILFKALK